MTMFGCQATEEDHCPRGGIFSLLHIGCQFTPRIRQIDVIVVRVNLNIGYVDIEHKNASNVNPLSTNRRVP
jgi:hypothetical protein